MTEIPTEPPVAGDEMVTRHTGHADLLREAIDGLVGKDPPPDVTMAVLGRRVSRSNFDPAGAADSAHATASCPCRNTTAAATEQPIVPSPRPRFGYAYVRPSMRRSADTPEGDPRRSTTESLTALCRPKGVNDPDRSAVRHGSEDGSVTRGGRRVAVRRPRVRSVDGTSEVAVPAYDLFTSTEVLDAMALQRMMAKLSTRRYRAGLEPLGAAVEATASPTSKSAVSRRFVAATETALAEILGADLSGLDLLTLMIDGVHFADHLCVVALGIGIDGTKHPLGVVEGATENATVVTDLLAGLRGRGLDTTRPYCACSTAPRRWWQR